MCKKERNRGTKCTNLINTKHGTQKATGVGQDPKKTQNTKKKKGENQKPLRNYCGRKNKKRKKKSYLRNATPKRTKCRQLQGK